MSLIFLHYFFFFNDTATTEIYTLSLHDALPIWVAQRTGATTYYVEMLPIPAPSPAKGQPVLALTPGDRKSTRLNSSHSQISYAVFCLKKKKIKDMTDVHYNMQMLNTRSRRLIPQ